ncbi:MAG: rhomboid family intramembrane serine protease [Dehalococcoidia bacterium]|nr:rhomboid family intramembrane serine protease [Dehalococcoidia bacterium]
MFPIRDLNPSRGAAVVTLAVIAVNVLVFLLWQPHTGTEADVAFLYRYTAVACELAGRHPVERAEIEASRCLARAAGVPLFPDKRLELSVGVSMFLHGGLLHLAGNMWFLRIFGDNVEAAFGHLGYALLYALAGVAATAGFALLHPDNVTPLVGASGAIAGVLGAYLVLFPTHTVLALWFLGLLPVPAVVFLGL